MSTKALLNLLVVLLATPFIICIAYCAGAVLLDLLYNRGHERKRLRQISEKVHIGDESECIKKLEARLIKEWTVNGYGAGYFHYGRDDSSGVCMRKVLSTAGFSCYRLLLIDHDMLDLIGDLEKVEQTYAPISTLHMAMVEAHHQIISNIECAMVYLQVDDCFEDLRNSPSPEHRNAIQDICEKNDDIIQSSRKLLEQTIEVLVADFAHDTSDKVIAALDHACVELKSLRQE